MLDMDTKTALQIARYIQADNIRETAREILANLDDDFRVEVGCAEYRIIEADEIERIHDDEIRELVDDLYMSDRNIPDVLRRYFDYDSFASDCRMSDGYGHHFSSYDGSEETFGSYYVFRTN